jgi:hypothetical protein
MENKKIKKINIIKNIIFNIKKNDFFEKDLIYFNYLNIIRDHDIFFDRYLPFFNLSNYGIIFFFIKKTIQNTTIILINLILSIFIYKKKNISKNSNILIISHFINNEDLVNDRYFGDLHFFLNEKYTVSRMLFNYNYQFIKDTNNIIFLNKYDNFILEFKLFHKQILLFFKYYKKIKIIKKTNKGILIKFYKIFLSTILSKETRNNLMYEQVLQNLVKKNNFTNIFCTIEGHNWEKITFKICKENNIRSIAYTSSMIFKNQKLLELNNYNIYNPDVIITNSLNNYNILKEKKLTKIIIKNIGSFNFKNYDFNTSENNIFKNKCHKQCLILPENTESELNIFINFANKYINQFSNINFIIKLHPGMKITNKLNKKLQKKQNKINYSNESLIKLVNQSDYILYRGSNAVLFGIAGNKEIVYLSIKNDFNINPIFRSEKSINIVSSEKELNNLSNSKSVIKNDIKNIYLNKIKKNEVLEFLF